MLFGNSSKTKLSGYYSKKIFERRHILSWTLPIHGNNRVITMTTFWLVLLLFFWIFCGECVFLLPVSWASERLLPSWWVSAVTAWPRLAVGIWTTCIKDSAPNPYCVWFFHTTKQGSDISWVSYTSALSWHYLPGDSIRSHRLRAPSCRTAPPRPPPPLRLHMPPATLRLSPGAYDRQAGNWRFWRPPFVV